MTTPTPIQTASLNQASRMVPQKAAGTPSAGSSSARNGDDFSFWDLVDIINPLQHIPIVSTIYRNLTGDTISNVARIGGGAIFGGFIGAAVGGINAIAVNETGEDLGDIAMTKMGLKDPAQKTDTARNDKVLTVEVTPSTQEIAKAKLRVTDHEQITWDQPATVAATTPIAKPVVAEPPKAVAAAALPDAKSLNELEPGNPNSFMPQTAEPAQIPGSMMKALAKYESMQRMGNAAAEHTGEILPKRKFAKLADNVRRY